MWSKIVLMAAEWIQNKDIAKRLHARPKTVTLGMIRSLVNRLDGISKDAPRPGMNPCISEKEIYRIIDITLYTKPSGATHWSAHTMAREVGVSHMTVNRIWYGHRLQPHRQRFFKLSSDPEFDGKMRDVVDLYMSPTDKAVAACMNEKLGLQALDRGRPMGISNEYMRNRTTGLFAALNILDITVIPQLHRRHRHRGFLIFLCEIDERVQKELDMCMVLDNLKTRSTSDVNKWLKRHPRFKLHFVPTDASWLNPVGPWLNQLTQKQVREFVPAQEIPH
jgi:hypothetical protein